MRRLVIIVSPAAELRGRVLEAAAGLGDGGPREPREPNAPKDPSASSSPRTLPLDVLVAPTLLEGRVLTEILRPDAILVDAAFTADGKRALATTATATSARLVLLHPAAAPPEGSSSGAAGHLIADAGLRAWLRGLPRNPPPAIDADDMLAQVRARYANSLGEKAAELAGHVFALLHGGADPAVVEVTQRLAHRLRGSAGSYGFPAFGEVAATIDGALLGGQIDPPPTSLQRAAELLALWRGGPTPLEAPRQWLGFSGSSALLGELAPLAQAAGLWLRLGEATGPAPSDLVAWIAEAGHPSGGGERPAIIVDPQEVRVCAGVVEERFPRNEIGRRLPPILEGLRLPVEAAAGSSSRPG